MASLGRSTEGAQFIPVRYAIDWSIPSRRGSLDVEGFAFETPGWPRFHACVRHNGVGHVHGFGWVVDHFESGLRVRQIKALSSMEAAPAALKKVLDRVGKKQVNKILRKYI